MYFILGLAPKGNSLNGINGFVQDLLRDSLPGEEICQIYITSDPRGIFIASAEFGIKSGLVDVVILISLVYMDTALEVLKFNRHIPIIIIKHVSEKLSRDFAKRLHILSYGSSGKNPFGKRFQEKLLEIYNPPAGNSKLSV